VTLSEALQMRVLIVEDEATNVMLTGEVVVPGG
jgi:hypothetical protein